MRKLSDNANRAVDELYRLDQQTNWFGRPRHTSDIIAGLVELSAYSEPASIPCICRFLFSKAPTVRDAAKEAISAMLSGLAPLELLHLSDTFGHEYGWCVGQPWHGLKPGAVRQLATTKADGMSGRILGLLSFHGNGYVREQAVRLLAALNDGTEVPFLLIRQNDWVGAISRRAQAAIEDRLALSYNEHWFDNIGLIAHLPEFGRNDLAHVTDATFALLLKPQCEDRLHKLLALGDRVTVRRFVRRTIDLPDGRGERVARLAIGVEDAVVRLWAARRLLSGSHDEALVRSLLEDRFAPVRREAYAALATNRPADAGRLWLRAALDPSAGTRDLARFHLRKLGVSDIRSHYLARLRERPNSLAALQGLAECATQEDSETLRDYTTSGRSSSRRVAIAGLARLMGEGLADDLVGWLADESPAVASQAARSLRTCSTAINGARLFVVLRDATTDSGRVACLRLFYEMGKWKSLPWLLQAFQFDNDLVRRQAEALASTWLQSNRVFTRPTEQERQAIEEAFAETVAKIPKPLEEEIRSLLPFDLAKASLRST